ncbi:delta-like protein C [Rhineura floridana]|uniref:delta-like protein C n=1 Tax=Rhineura floridana TaxID=261503 RepID=UPI002AC81B27|nr:delta-like protein C [Rhineura floridana]
MAKMLGVGRRGPACPLAVMVFDFPREGSESQLLVKESVLAALKEGDVKRFLRKALMDPKGRKAYELMCSVCTINVAPFFILSDEEFCEVWNPAYHAQTCLNRGVYDGVKCRCPPSFYGPRCEFLVDGSPTPATSIAPEERPTTTTPPVLCQNGGHFNGSNCVCPPGYWGLLCESFDTKDCLNGGIWSGTDCLCTRYFWGRQCEFVMNVIEVNADY